MTNSYLIFQGYLMKFNKTILLALLTSIFLCFSSLSIAEEPYRPYDESHRADESNEPYVEGYVEVESIAREPIAEKSYGRKIGDKALRGLSNMFLCFIEIPKNIIIVSNRSYFVWGITAGTLLGAINTLGRFSVGALDLVTFPLATKPIVYPVHPWQNYLEINTDYYDMFDLDFATDHDTYNDQTRPNKDSSSMRGNVYNKSYYKR